MFVGGDREPRDPTLALGFALLNPKQDSYLYHFPVVLSQDKVIIPRMNTLEDGDDAADEVLLGVVERCTSFSVIGISVLRSKAEEAGEGRHDVGICGFGDGQRSCYSRFVQNS